MKKLLLPIAIVLFSILSPFIVSYSYAQTVEPSTTRQQRQQQRLDTRSMYLKTRGNSELTRRIAALNELITKINGFKKLSDTQKSTFVTNIQSQITSLTALQIKINNDTDVATLKTDVQSIITSYRIFALYLPQINIIAFADRLLFVSDQLTELSNKLQIRIQQSKTNGHDVISLTSTLTDMQTKISDAKIQAQNAISTVTPLTPDGYPGNKTTLQSAHTMITTALIDLEGKNGTQGVKQDIQLIIQGLKIFSSSKVTPSPTKGI